VGRCEKFNSGFLRRSFLNSTVKGFLKLVYNCQNFCINKSGTIFLDPRCIRKPDDSRPAVKPDIEFDIARDGTFYRCLRAAASFERRRRASLPARWRKTLSATNANDSSRTSVSSSSYCTTCLLCRKIVLPDNCTSWLLKPSDRCRTPASLYPAHLPIHAPIVTGVDWRQLPQLWLRRTSSPSVVPPRIRPINRCCCSARVKFAQP